ncbi:Protein CBG06229 [Caenorhabditis briggsae]|uniref:Protein CBG06229 n=2 Tax=Caenorhabditis briggsae TaxID=6238 RepID=A8X0L2_CAEBR|nr:Protein CBG06229 [Caenorhabditis briggsae]ULT95677.1 hypothetical protein L3Y34_004398 [Caenorhabditis briggsae]CAP26172.1 Protein CBG06229 [Caenorhabditis briggsae]
MNKVTDYNTWWFLNHGVVHVEIDGVVSYVMEDMLDFSGTTTDLDIKDLQSDSVEQIVERILNIEGAWSIVYYNRKLEKLFIGRDVFGRQSMVFNFHLKAFGCRSQRKCAGEWVEIPFGQVTVFDPMMDQSPTVYSYFESYPVGIMEKYFPKHPPKHVFVHNKDPLLNVSRAIGGRVDVSNAKLLFQKVTDATKALLRKYNKSHVIVCLSGGVDSTFIAHAVHASVDSDMTIDLVNVAFGSGKKECEKAPDRSRVRKALESLRVAYPKRKFRLILVNVDKKTLEQHRTESIALAAEPAVTVLDDSLSCVLWFALRGEGLDSDNMNPVTSPATTCLLGSGADELLAGYARHRTRFEKEKIPRNIAEECENELRRLGSRNGGRDARVASQLKKTIMSPLLEDTVVIWLNSLPVDSKWDLSLKRGVGEKQLLREAVKMLGSPYDAPKQAMQFGSRMAKMSNGSKTIKGSDKSPHLAIEDNL